MSSKANLAGAVVLAIIVGSLALSAMSSIREVSSHPVNWVDTVAKFAGIVAVVGGWLLWIGTKRLREPHLVIEAKDHVREDGFSVLQIFVKNEAVDGFLAGVLLLAIARDNRPVAENCRFTVDVSGLDRSERYAGMPGRWNDAPEPLVPYIPRLKQSNEPMKRWGYGRHILGIPSMAHSVDKTLIDLFPGEEEAGAGIFIKHSCESKCYGFNTGSYFWKRYQQSDLELDAGCYRVSVRVRSGSYETSECFELINRESKIDERHFDLRPATLGRLE